MSLLVKRNTNGVKGKPAQHVFENRHLFAFQPS